MPGNKTVCMYLSAEREEWLSTAAKRRGHLCQERRVLRQQGDMKCEMRRLEGQLE